eukprot:TRINITY_DN7061_c1_g1_i2.p1 TRINITY_DN7061_c1_g1~~TRINITY_DN7061_c1_g1_i2.p1  ORF type:complete len:305 (-),score=46.49 TRINITY_DN7061_c1_g1_i2:44-958(-)
MNQEDQVLPNGSPVVHQLLAISQDHSRLLCSNLHSYSVYPVSNIVSDQPLRQGHGGVSCMSILDNDILALVGSGSDPYCASNKVKILDAYQLVILEIELRQQILNVALTHENIVLVTTTRTLIYDFATLHLIREVGTVKNDTGIVLVGSLNNERILVTLGVDSLGTIRIYREHFNDPVLIHAHDNAIQCMALSKNGDKLATASKKGTLIRIWDTTSGEEIKCVRRGAAAVEIHSLDFSDDEEYLCLSSSNKTIHIFNITPINMNSSWLGYTSYEKSLMTIPLQESHATVIFGEERNTLKGICSI